MPIKLSKAGNSQSFFKVAAYGPQGSGKTFTMLLLAEMLAKKMKKRIAYIDTEHGTDWYAIEVKERKVHPTAFDFDRDVTKSLLDTRDFLRTVDTDKYGVVILDSITHLWESAKEAWTGKMNSNGQFPIQAWSTIKRPYKQLMDAGVNGKFHWLLCGRQQNMFGKDDSGDMESQGTRIKAEGETGYEPHILLRFFQEMEENTHKQIIKMYVEKDRSGCLMGRTIEWPKAEDFIPALNYLTGTEQGSVASSDLAAENDAAILQKEKETYETDQRNLFESIRKAILDAQDLPQLKVAWGLTDKKKKALGDYWENLEGLKDARKLELQTKGVTV